MKKAIISFMIFALLFLMLMPELAQQDFGFLREAAQKSSDAFTSLGESICEGKAVQVLKQLGEVAIGDGVFRA